MNRVVTGAMVLSAGLLVAGCAPADVEGTYSVSITNGTNGCGLSGFNPGDTSQNNGFTITQTGSAVSGTIDNAITAAIFDAWLGGHVFTGTVSGSHVDMVLHGTRAMSSNGCAYTWDARVQGDLTGNALQGTITYTASAPDTSACAQIRMCSTVQTFSGSRPPR